MPPNHLKGGGGVKNSPLCGLEIFLASYPPVIYDYRADKILATSLILSLSNSYNNAALIQKNRGNKSHRVTLEKNIRNDIMKIL